MVAPGINGKMNELQAAFGLLQLKHIGAAIAERREIDGRYRELLAGVTGIRCVGRTTDTVSNFAYFPIFIDDEYHTSRDALNEKLREHGIFARRYFYPLVAEFPMYRGLPSASVDNLPVALEASRQVLCLPIYPGLGLSVVDEIGRLIASSDG